MLSVLSSRKKIRVFKTHSNFVAAIKIKERNVLVFAVARDLS